MILIKVLLTNMWELFGILTLLLTTGTFSVEGKLFLFRHRIPPPEEPEFRTSPEWGTFTQRVDHFDPADNRTWQMRYVKNTDFYEEGRPMFLYIGGEWNITSRWVTSGLMFDMARLHKGILFYTEHRFYGSSYPIGDLTVDSLKYLSADQALADLVYFIEYQKQNTPGLRNSTVIVEGSSYAGALATWARIKYPHIVDIAYSSSGPLYAKADFTEYYEVVEENLRLASPSCPKLIKSAMVKVTEMLKTRNGSANVSKLFRSCKTVNGSSELDRSYFLSSIPFEFGSVVQSAQPGDVVAACRALENQTGSDVEKFAKYVRPSKGCIDYSYNGAVEYLSATKKGATDDERQWMYQTCTEFGWFQTRGFGGAFTVDLYYQMCKDIFGKDFDSYTLNNGTERTNLFYGGKKPKVTRLVTCQGTVDPWSKLGLEKNLNEDTVTIIVNGTSHSADLYSIRDSDSDQLKRAKNKIMDTISAWIIEKEEKYKKNPQ
ncbi:putative serine protease K12H4.7 [Agrilus planipennis]|uniref:Serine protease K12H4.7 n=1 Tax=Agrilus planipennis TaxID=224129 RepID=A0A7F5R7Z9_AGRPL|nr:putative serine protease K12H4.7 [Agrilus planipennis]